MDGPEKNLSPEAPESGAPEPGPAEAGPAESGPAEAGGEATANGGSEDPGEGGKTGPSASLSTSETPVPPMEAAEAASPEGESVGEPQPELSAPLPEAPTGPGYGTGRRKTSVARVYLRSGSGRIRVNGRSLEEFFLGAQWREQAREPLHFVDGEHYDAEITVKGGGSSGQAGAVRLGLARALVAANPALRPKLRKGGFLTRDSRIKERKKYGQKGARKRFQWTKL
ncbi:MAG: 30S ribosomal protein S9 [Candidatus Acidoferrales bacterium]